VISSDIGRRKPNLYGCSVPADDQLDREALAS
jgi:hypothetical protein